MSLTAVDVHNVAFRKAPFGKRGYDEEEVDAFLNLVETTIAELQAEIARRGGAAAQPAPTSQPPAVDVAVLVELDQIKQRLARIEKALGTSPAL